MIDGLLKGQVKRKEGNFVEKETINSTYLVNTLSEFMKMGGSCNFYLLLLIMIISVFMLVLSDVSLVIWSFDWIKVSDKVIFAVYGLIGICTILLIVLKDFSFYFLFMKIVSILHELNIDQLMRTDYYWYMKNPSSRLLAQLTRD